MSIAYIIVINCMSDYFGLLLLTKFMDLMNCVSHEADTANCRWTLTLKQMEYNSPSIK